MNPMLFQASAENSEPTCETPNATSSPKTPLAAVTVGNQPAQEIRARFNRLRVANRPEMRKIVGNRRVISAHKHAQQNQTQQAKASSREVKIF